MACSNCSTGPFVNAHITNQWISAQGTITLPNRTTVTLTTAGTGSTPGITVQNPDIPTRRVSVLTPLNGSIFYMNWGTPRNFLAILTMEGGLGSRGRVVQLVNTFTLNAINIIGISADSTVNLPFLTFCPGDGSVILKAASSGSQLTGVGLVTADDGISLLGIGTYIPSNTLRATATPTGFEVFDGPRSIGACLRPSPYCSVTPNPVEFPDAVIGAGVPGALTQFVRPATIRNIGTSCFTVAGFTNNGPFTFVAGSSSRPLPVTLQPSEEFIINVNYAPTSIGSFDLNLNITPAPSSGDIVIRCMGTARPPQLRLTTNSPLNFGTVPVGTTVSRTLNINNTGEADINVIIPPPPAGSAYTWIPPVGAAAVCVPTASINIPIAFSPMVRGENNTTLTFTSNANGSPHNMQLNGSGCVPTAVLSVISNPVNLGNVQRGFRTLRIVTVENTGNGTLQFGAQIQAITPGDPISEADAQLFGILHDNTTAVTAPSRGFTGQAVNPRTACGAVATGSGQFLFGVTFFANDVNRVVNARLVINDTTNAGALPFIINLSAIIVNSVTVDVQLVLDRSGSMSDTSGSRVKIQTAIDAAKLFVRLSRPDVEDRIGLIRFNNVPEVVRSIDFITGGNQTAIENTINPTNFNPGGLTAVAGGVLVAQNDINSHPRANVPDELSKIIVVLTDGRDNTPFLNPEDGVSYSLLGGNGTTTLPVPTDFKIYAIGIGDNIDIGRLGTLATTTGGVFLQAREFSGADYFNLEKHFTQVYMEAANFAQIIDPVFEIIPGETQKLEFEVLKGDKSAIVVIYDHNYIRLPFYLLTPKNEIIDLLTIPAGYQIRPGISPTARFIEVNMPQGEPERYAGTWKAIIEHDGRACSFTPSQETKNILNINNFGQKFQPLQCKENHSPIKYGIAIGVGSNLNMVAFVNPGIVSVGEPILLTAMISEYNLPVTGCRVTVKAQRPDRSETTHYLFDDGLHSDNEPNDGTYAVLYSNTFQEGTYTFIFSASGQSRDGKQIYREMVRSKYVEGREKLIPLDIPGNEKDKCCKSIKLLLRIGIIIILLIAIFFFWALI